MPDLSEDQWELGGVTFGHGCDVEVMGFEIAGAGSEVGDALLPSEDGAVFGRDTVGAQTLTWDLLVNKTSGATAQAAWRTLRSVWDAASTRRTPGAVLPLSLRRPGGSTVMVYGRPRKMEPSNLRLTREGVVELVADFTTADHKFYSGAERTLTLTLLNGSTGQESALNDGDTFEDGVEGWTTTGCTLVQAASGTGYEGEYAGAVTPDGSTAQVYLTSDPFDVSEGVRYHPGVWVQRKASGPAIPMMTSIRFYDLAGTLISESTSNATDAAAGSWAKATGTFLAPAGSVTAEMRVSYNGTTPASSEEVYIDNARTVEMTGFGFPLAWPQQLTGSGKKASAVTNAGDLDTWPVFVFEGPISNPTVAYVGTDKRLKLTMSIPAGQSVTVDTRPWVRTALRGGIASVAGKLSGSRMAEMALPPGSTVVAFRGQDTTGLSRCRIFWRDAASTP